MYDSVMMTFVFDVDAYENKVTPSKEINASGRTIWESTAHLTLPSFSVTPNRFEILHQLSCDQDSVKGREKKDLLVNTIIKEMWALLQGKPPIQAIHFKWSEDRHVTILKLLAPWDVDKFIKG